MITESLDIHSKGLLEVEVPINYYFRVNKKNSKFSNLSKTLFKINGMNPHH